MAPIGTTRLKRAGGSLVMTVPAAARDALHLSAGTMMSVAVEDDHLVLTPSVPRRRYTLAELLAEEKAAGVKPLAAGDVWGNAQGRETW